MRYADPTRCPDCRQELPASVPVCPTCDLLVRHPLAVELFGVLSRADGLVEDLRTASTSFHSAALTPEPTPPAAPVLGGPLGDDAVAEPIRPAAPATPTAAPAPQVFTPFPAAAGTTPQPDPIPRTGLSVSSIPKILLALGAFCLLTAGVIFLAVSWSALGVAGRTGVLTAFTVVSLSSSVFLHGRGLRIAGESLSVVGLGMLGLDFLGAGAAGWLPTSSTSGAVAVAGLVLAAAGTGLGLVRIRGQERLVAPQVIAAMGLAGGYLGAVDATEHHLVAAHVFVVAALIVTFVARQATETVLLRGALAAAALPWLGGALTALVQGLDDPTLDQLWADGTGWSLLLSAAFLLAPGAILRERKLGLVGATGAALVLTVTATLPAIDGDLPSICLVALIVTAAWVLALGVLPSGFRVVAMAPSGAGVALLSGLVLTTTTTGLIRWTDLWVGLTSSDRTSLTLGLSGPDPVTAPSLTVPSLLVISTFVALLDSQRTRAHLITWLRSSGVMTGVGVAITLASYDVALAAVIGALLVTAIGCHIDFLRSTGRGAEAMGSVGLVLAGVATVGALPSPALTLIVATVTAGALVLLATLRTDGFRIAGGLFAAPFVGLAIASGVETGGASNAWIAVPVLLGVGVLALALPRTEVEVMAGLTALVALTVSLPEVRDGGGFSSLWLCVAGFLCCASALITPARRSLAWVGIALLLLASWVRLLSLSVEAPEAYTLPIAAILLGIGVMRLQRSPEVSSAAALVPGLLPALVPSVLWVLGDPLSLRALLLGAGCLALITAGTALRWSAPLVAGTVAGTIVVLREIGPYASDVPQWVWIALAGAVLTGLGITWERRVIEVRRTVGFLGRLR